MIDEHNERRELRADEISRDAVGRRDLVSMIRAAGVAGLLGPFAADLAFAAAATNAASHGVGGKAALPLRSRRHASAQCASECP